MKEKKVITKDFFIGNLGDTKVTDQIKNAYLKTIGSSLEELVDSDGEGIIGHEPLVEHTIRKCYISWMNVDNCNFIEQGLRSIIENTNHMIWKKSLLHEWQAKIQFTKYIGKGDHYNWHTDAGLEKSSLLERKLSIVYCLSKKSDYTGGEFQIKTSNNGIYSKKFDYGDFIVFPSDIMHRVKPLKSGTRITMVGWYR